MNSGNFDRYVFQLICLILDLKKLFFVTVLNELTLTHFTLSFLSVILLFYIWINVIFPFTFLQLFPNLYFNLFENLHMT